MRHLGQPLRDGLRRLRRRTAVGPRSARLAVVALILLTLAGGGWLLVAPGTPSALPVTDAALPPEQLTAAAAALTDEGIAHTLAAGRLLTDPASLARAREVLAERGLLDGPADDPFTRLADEQDLWSTERSHERRWVAAKMTTLGRLIGRFPQIRRATVLLEPGEPRRLGGGGIAPTAAVTVCLTPGERMTPWLVDAIADLVSGSVAGMERQAVSVIDEGGRSYRSCPQTAELSRRRAAEAYFVDRIRTALRFAGDVSVDVVVQPAPDAQGPPQCLSAWISVPRSYLNAIHAAAPPAEAPDGDDPDLRRLPATLAAVRAAAARAGGLADPSAVEVQVHDDVAPIARPAFPSVQSLPASLLWAMAGGAGGLLLAILAATWFALRRRRSFDACGAEAAMAGAASLPEGADAWYLFELVASEDLLQFLHPEHPQTIAVVLSRLSSDKAAEVLSGLPADKQVEVSRRIANLDTVTADTVREVASSLAEQLREFIASRASVSGGEAKLAELLQHAGTATEKNVLRSLYESEPRLAESLRTRMLSFDDIARLSDWRLRAVAGELQAGELALALHAAGRDTVRKVLSALAPSVSRTVRAEMERIGPVRLSDVEAAQQRVVEALRIAEGGTFAPEAATEESDVVV